MRKIFYVAILLIIVTSCDIQGKIELINTSKNHAFYKYFTENRYGIIDTTNINLSGQGSACLLFEFGQYWTDTRIKEYLSSIKRIELITNTDSLILTDKNEMFNYFKKCRKGLFKEKIKIKLH